MSPDAGLSFDQILAAPDLDALWVLGEDPLHHATLASEKAFVVVQDMFRTKTAQRADVVFPSASAYEKSGTVTNVCGEVQRLKAALKIMGTKPDLEIMGLLSKEMGVNIGIWSPDKVFDEIRKTVHGYNISLPLLAAGGAAQTMPVNGRVEYRTRPELVQSANDTLFTSGYLGRYSKTLNSVLEAPGKLYQGK
jgi:NADH-quinone oxidoreductase subunit G